MIQIENIQRAAEVLEGVAIKTPLVFSNFFSQRCGSQVYLKLENLQKTGSFKFRGAYHKLFTNRNHFSPGGVVAASAGNHAQGVAHAAQLMGVSSSIVMPEWASISKQLSTRSYGGEVILSGRSLAESLARARELEAEGRTFIHPYDDEDIIAGQGTVGLEIVAQLPEVETILVPVGGGGLIAGIATAVKFLRPQASVIGVQAAACPSALAARRLGKPLAVPARKSIADGITVKEVGQLPFALIQSFVDDLVTVEEEQIATAILDLLERKKIVAEGSGAVPLAALMSNRLSCLRGQVVVLVVSGGNVDTHLLGRILRQGLFKSHRIMRFSVLLPDVPGALADLLKVVANRRGNILHVSHDRLGRHLPVDLSRVELEVETRGSDHIQELIAALSTSGYEVESR
ncbi:MAG: threonine ammonia-lyase [Deltaproteobacteria bacterium]|nr:MAG: threonine ammonia-lyase [Deltaproteobacteria bacterium]